MKSITDARCARSARNRPSRAHQTPYLARVSYVASPVPRRSHANTPRAPRRLSSPPADHHCVQAAEGEAAVLSLLSASFELSLPAAAASFPGPGASAAPAEGIVVHAKPIMQRRNCGSAGLREHTAAELLTRGRGREMAASEASQLASVTAMTNSCSAARPRAARGASGDETRDDGTAPDQPNKRLCLVPMPKLFRGSLWSFFQRENRYDPEARMYRAYAT